MRLPFSSARQIRNDGHSFSPLGFRSLTSQQSPTSHSVVNMLEDIDVPSWRLPSTSRDLRGREMDIETGLTSSSHFAAQGSGTSFVETLDDCVSQPLSEARRARSFSMSRSRSRSRSRHESVPGSAIRPISTAPSRASGRRSRAASHFSSGDTEPVVCALSEARGAAASVGIAIVKMGTGDVILSQICDSRFYSQTIHRLQVLEPTHVLFVASSCPPKPKSQLFSFVEEFVPGIKILSLERQYWSEAAGLDYIDGLAVPNDAATIKVAIQGNFYATCALAAVCQSYTILAAI
jgi:hypothetical protein